MRKKVWIRVILGISMLPIVGIAMNTVVNIEQDRISASVLEVDSVEEVRSLDSSDERNIEIPDENPIEEQEPILELEEPILQGLEENKVSEEENEETENEAPLDTPIYEEEASETASEEVVEKEPSQRMTINGLTYTFSGTDGNSTATVTGGTSIPTNLVIPDSVTNTAANWKTPSPVTEIGESAFQKKGLQSVKLPKGLIKIYRYAFEENNLKSVVFPESIDDISLRAFYKNQLTEVTLLTEKGRALRWLGELAFANNSIKTLTIQDNLHEPKGGAPGIHSNGSFQNNPLEVINVVNSTDAAKGVSLTNLRTNVFTPEVLKNVTARTVLRSKSGYNSGTSLTNTKSTGQSVQFGIESQFQLNNTTDRVWQNYNLGAIKWFKDGKELSGKTSSNLSLSNLQLSDSGVYHATVGTERYPDIKLTVEGFTFGFKEEEGVRTARVTGYSGTIPTDLVIPDTATNTAEGWPALPVTIIGESAFKSKGLQSVTLPKDLYQISAMAFEGNNLKTIDFPESIGDISREAFKNNQLTEVTILTEKGRVFRWLGDDSFRGNNIETVTIPDNLPDNVSEKNTVKSRVFEENPLKVINVVNSSDATKPSDLMHTRTLLTALRLGAVTERTVLRSKVVAYTTGTNLTNAKVSGESVQFELDAGFQLNNITNRVWQTYSPSTIKWFKDGKELAGQTATKLNLSNLQASDSGVYHATVGTERYPDINLAVEGFTFTFEGTEGNSTATVTGYSGTIPTDLVIPDTARNTDAGWTIPSTVVTIGNMAFFNSRLTSVVIPETIITIMDQAFFMNQLTEIIIPPNVERIESHAFNTNQLREVTIPPSVTFISHGAFASNLITKANISDGVLNINNSSGIFDSNPLEVIEVSAEDPTKRVNLERKKDAIHPISIGYVTEHTIIRTKKLQYTEETVLNSTVMEGDQVAFEIQPEYQLESIAHRSWEMRTIDNIQWYKDAGELSGEVSNKLELTDIKESDRGNYRAQREGEYYPEITLTVNLDTEPAIPPVDPNGPSVLPDDTNPMIEGLSLRYVSPLNFGTHEFSQKNEIYFSEPLKDTTGQEYFPMVAVQDMRPEAERSGWELVVSLEQELEQGAQIRMTPFIDDTYQQNFNVGVAQNQLIIETSSQRFAETLVNPNPSGIVSMGMGAGGNQGVELLVPGGTGVGKYSGVLKWELVSGP